MFASINRPGWRVGVDDTQGEEKLRTFDVLVDEDDNRKAIKAGWSWPAFLFGSIWALFSGLWGIGTVMLPIEFILALLVNALDQVIDRHQQIYDNKTSAILLLIISIPFLIRIVFGIFGNRWKLKKLTNAGYSLLDSVKASSRKEAKLSCRHETGPLNRRLRALVNPSSSPDESYPPESHISNSESNDPDRIQVNDIAKILLALIIGITICSLSTMHFGIIIGCLPVYILLAGFIASLMSGNAKFIVGTTNLISVIGWIFLSVFIVMSIFMQYIAFNVPPDGWINQGDYAVSIPILGMEYIYPDQILRNRNLSAAISLFFLLGIVALRFLWLFPLSRQFDAIRSISFDRKCLNKSVEPNVQGIIAGSAIRWLWTASTAFLFLILLSHGHGVAATFIAISGLVAAPSLAAVFHRYGGSEKLRSRICLGAAGLSYAAMLLFTTLSSSGGNAGTEGRSNEPAVPHSNETTADNSPMMSQRAFDATSQPAVTPPLAYQSLTGCIAIDGDTLKCESENIRLLGIDAPEMPGHCRLGRECVQGDPFASQVSLQNSISYTMNIVRVGTDRYGRTLGLVYANGQNLSCIQLSRGQAAYIPDWDNGSRVANECGSAQF